MQEPGFYNMDCMEAIKQFPDGFFDLAIVDPPYGTGGGRSQAMTGQDSGDDLTAIKIVGGGATSLHTQRKNVRLPNGCWGYANWRNLGGEVRGKIIAWDVAPGEDYFNELFRVSRDQIIWGANYFKMPPSRNFVIWDKKLPEDFSMAMAEYAWVSMPGNAKIFRYMTGGQPGRFHPTQKPIDLYSWLLARYAKPGYKILDTHVGSASSLIACERAGLPYWGYEIDPEYYKLAKERMERECAQLTMTETFTMQNEQIGMKLISNG